ncbi:MAG: amidohydrolase family protein [Gemmatimonadota bacterium]|nr:amidohydrolase family protein [Gemmatimonadota bacterium]
MIIDVHNHYYPAEFVEAVRAGPSNFRLTDDAEGNPVLHSPGDYNVLVPGHRDLEYRTSVLDEAGVDRQLITLTAPGSLLETPERGAELARIVNDGLAAAVRGSGGRYLTLAHLPLHNPQAAVDELERCMVELGMPGAMLYSNANGVPLADARFLPLWELGDRYGAVFYIHPTYPVGVEAMEQFMLMPMVGFLMDTTLAAAHLVYAGIPDRFPNTEWVLGHLGGAVPYLAERFDRGYEAFRQNREFLRRPPSEVLRDFYYDTVNFDPGALRLAIEFAGVDRILAGSDYPHMIGSIDRMLTSIRGLGLDPDDESAILGENAARLFDGD